MIIKLNHKNLLTISFGFFLICEIVFAHTIISQAALFLFCGLCICTTKKLYINPFLISYVGMVIVSFAIILSGNALDRQVALSMTYTICLNCLFLFSFSQYCGKVGDSKPVFHTYMKVAIPIATMLVILGIPVILAGGRLTTLGVNSNTISTLVAYSLVIYIYDIVERNAYNIRSFSLMLFMLLVIFLTGSRKGLLIPFIGSYVILCAKKPKKIIKYTLIAMFAFAIALFLIMKIGFLYNMIGYRVEPVLLYLTGAEYEEASLATRTHYIAYAWEHAKENSFRGQGLDCFRTLRQAYDTYSHCNYVELLFSLGWVGTVVYYSSFVLALCAVPRALKKNKKGTVLLLAILIPFMVCDFFNITYYTRRMLILPSTAIMFLQRYAKGKC